MLSTLLNTYALIKNQCYECHLTHVIAFTRQTVTTHYRERNIHSHAAIKVGLYFKKCPYCISTSVLNVLSLLRLTAMLLK